MRKALLQVAFRAWSSKDRQFKAEWVQSGAGKLN